MLRWWDGTQWTEHRQPIPPPPAPGATSSTGYDSGAGFGYQPTTGGPIAEIPPAYGGQASGYPSYQGPGSRWGGFGRGRVAGANTYSLTALAFAAVYLVLAATTHVVLIGIVPVLMAVRAFGRKEKLAPLAAVAAAVVVITFILFI